MLGGSVLLSCLSSVFGLQASNVHTLPSSVLIDIMSPAHTVSCTMLAAQNRRILDVGMDCRLIWEVILGVPYFERISRGEYHFCRWHSPRIVLYFAHQYLFAILDLMHVCSLLLFVLSHALTHTAACCFPPKLSLHCGA